jgi:hypothetical protein
MQNTNDQERTRTALEKNHVGLNVEEIDLVGQEVAAQMADAWRHCNLFEGPEQLVFHASADGPTPGKDGQFIEECGEIIGGVRGETVGHGSTSCEGVLVGLALLCQAGPDFLWRESFASFALREAFVQAREKMRTTVGETLTLCFNEIERMGNQIGGVAVKTCLENSLKALFGSGIEGHGHGMSITLGLRIPHYAVNAAC